VKSVASADGTVIAYEQQGSGPALIIVDGAMSARGGKAALRALLVPQLTVFGYDRRGRGDSGDTLPYAVDQEIEDIRALIEVAGGTAALYGHSSGAALALDAALQLGASVTRIARYEPPYASTAIKAPGSPAPAETGTAMRASPWHHARGARPSCRPVSPGHPARPGRVRSRTPPPAPGRAGPACPGCGRRAS